MIVMKFGGSSVANAERIRNVAEIVESHAKSNPVVVVSAIGDTTDQLISLAEELADGKGKGKFDEIVKNHHNVIKELGLGQDIISEEVKELEELVNILSLSKELIPRILDNIMSFGERMSVRLLAGCISSMGLEATAYDAYDLGFITNSNYGKADLLPDTYARIRRAFKKISGVPVITGFIGKDREGNITTLGRGGSDYTASTIGAAIDADEIQIWSDVNGLMTADPRVVGDAKSVDFISFEEASELAFLGVRGLHPKTILPAVSKNINVRILNTFNPGYKGTVIIKDPKEKNRIASIASKKKMTVINIHTPKMFHAQGFLRKIFEIFDNNNISVDMVSTSEINVSVTLNGSGKNEIANAMKELRKFADVEVRENRAKISLVGDGLVSIPGILEKIFSSLNGIPIELISHSTSEINHSLVVKEGQADEAVRLLHKEFFGA